MKIGIRLRTLRVRVISWLFAKLGAIVQRDIKFVEKEFARLAPLIPAEKIPVLKPGLVQAAVAPSPDLSIEDRKGVNELELNERLLEKTREISWRRGILDSVKKN